MSNTTLRFSMPPPVVAPRGAAVAAGIWLQVADAGRAIWRVLEAHGQARAAPVLREIGERHRHSDPELSRRLLGASRHPVGR